MVGRRSGVGGSGEPASEGQSVGGDGCPVLLGDVEEVAYDRDRDRLREVGDEVQPTCGGGAVLGRVNASAQGRLLLPRAMGGVVLGVASTRPAVLGAVQVQRDP